ncbi:TPA: molecular chaperone [Klebsiella quasipneumoniae subsp. similipneumoniae]|nr:molecular chaperone [Klebsiella quasipneumoniae subsp. similipneumoniae]
MKLKIILLYVFFICFYISNARADINYPHPDETSVLLEKDDNTNLLKGVLRIRNPGNQPWLVQSWAEDDQKKKSKIVFPNLTRLEPDSVKNLTIVDKKNKQNNKFIVVLFIPNTDDDDHNIMSIPVAYKLKISYKD